MLIYINPKTIKNFLRLNCKTFHTESIKINLTSSRYKGKRFTGLIIQDEAIQTGRPVERCPHFRGTIQRFHEGLDWHQTEYKRLYETWYTKMAEGLYRNKTFEEFHKHRLENWDAIFNDIKKNGYKMTTPTRDNIEIALNPSGEPLLIDGRHRLAMAKILSIKEVPTTVNIISESIAKQVSDNNLNQHEVDQGLIQAIKEHAPRLARQLHHKDLKNRLALAVRSAYPKKFHKPQ